MGLPTEDRKVRSNEETCLAEVSPVGVTQTKIVGMSFLRNTLILYLFLFSLVLAQPENSPDGVSFSYDGNAGHSVTLVGDFNGWAKEEDPLKQDATGIWRVVKKLKPGLFQYKFLVDGDRYEIDPENAATVENYNRSGMNSVFLLTETGHVVLTGNPEQPKSNLQDVYPHAPGKKPVSLNIIWHQHQPLYVDPQTDQLKGPWVRTHATKDYFDMAAMLEKFPRVHCTINLTSSLIHQLRQFYLERLGPHVDLKKNTIDVEAFWSRWKGRTDPWIDLALKPAEEFDDQDRAYLYGNAWNAFGISEVMIERFPEYLRLKQKLAENPPKVKQPLSVQQMREAKFWFYLAYFDPDFLMGPVNLPDGSKCDLSDLVEFKADKKFYLKREITEADCRRMVVEAYKVMANVIPIHKRLLYDPALRRGQIEVITTPYYHPILPLIYDTDIARISQPVDQLPARFSYPEDARAHVTKAVKMYSEIFGIRPNGIWPAEGSLAQPVLGLLHENGISWTATDVKVLKRSMPVNQPNTTPYRFPAGANSMTLEEQWLAIVFRDTELSDRIGFKYQSYEGEEAAEDFVQAILTQRPNEGDPDVLVTVILDGENAWEWYRKDMDGKQFLHSLYRKLTSLYEANQVITTTTSEYLTGNTKRGISAHPVEALPAMEELHPGSWINANFDTWIGEPEENTAWSYLLRARQDLAASGIEQPDASRSAPMEGTHGWYEYMAWEEMYAAEGSDWFWWYGSDQSAPAGDQPFDRAFLIHLRNVYRFAELAGRPMQTPEFQPIILAESSRGGGGTMARGDVQTQAVLFTCDASVEAVVSKVFIVGNLEKLGGWTPNLVGMQDDGTSGDRYAGDGIWSLKVDVPVGRVVSYKYTNSGKQGKWVPGEEFPGQNRTLHIEQKSEEVLVVTDVFGKSGPE